MEDAKILNLLGGNQQTSKPAISMSAHTNDSKMATKCSRSGPTITFPETEEFASAVFGPHGGNREVNRIYARRIAACFRACAGIATEDMEDSSMTIIEYMEDQYAEKIETITKQRAELLDALGDLLPAMPPEDAPCHRGICEQSRCAHCQRIAKGYEIIAKAKS